MKAFSPENGLRILIIVMAGLLILAVASIAMNNKQNKAADSIRMSAVDQELERIQHYLEDGDKENALLAVMDYRKEIELKQIEEN